MLGTALRREFAQRGWGVTRLVRGTASGPDVAAWDPVSGVVQTERLEGHDAVVHLAGENIAGLWTSGKKQRIEQSRVRGTLVLVQALLSLRAKPAMLLSSSGVGYYGKRPAAEAVTEDAQPGAGFMANVCERWEEAATRAEPAGIRVVRMRTAPVLTPEGGMLAAMLPVFRMGLGASFGSGEQPWPWIALDDMVRAILHIMEHSELSGPMNMASPGAVTNAEFASALARAVGRSAQLRIPEWAARLAPNGMGDELLLSGARAVPARLLETGFVFHWPELGAALQAMLAER